MLWSYAPAAIFYLDAGKYSYFLSDHLLSNGDRAPTNQVGAALAQSKLHRAAILIEQRASVIAEQSAVTFATRKPDVLLDGLFRWQGLAAASVVAA